MQEENMDNPTQVSGNFKSENLCTAKEAAEMCRISRASWYYLVKQGNAPQAIRFGRRTLRWRVEDVINYANKGIENKTH